MQIINALTLSLVPYTITQRYEFAYVLQEVRSGAQYITTVRASDTTWVEPLLIVTLPFADRGHLTTMQRVGDDLYEQFRSQGAFTAVPSQPNEGSGGAISPTPTSPAATARRPPSVIAGSERG